VLLPSAPSNCWIVTLPNDWLGLVERFWMARNTSENRFEAGQLVPASFLNRLSRNLPGALPGWFCGPPPCGALSSSDRLVG
jgi:hypothetical protein